MKRILKLVTLFLLAYTSATAARQDPIQVSMVQLLASPTTYEGKKVAVSGFLHLEFEGDAIYLHQDYYKNQIYKNGLWVSCNSEVHEQFKKASDGYVMVVGRFTTETKGHFGMWSGTIEKIDRVILLPINRNAMKEESNQPVDTTPASAPR